MDLTTQEYYLQWIISDYTPFRFDEREFFLATPSREARFQAERIYMLTHSQGEEAGLYNESEILKLLNKYEIWNTEKEENLNKLTKDINDIKLNIYESFSNTNKRNAYKKALKETVKYIEKLVEEKQTFDNYSLRYVAMFAKQHFLTGSSIYRKRNKPALGNFWATKDDEIIQYSYKIMSEYMLNDNDYRLLARNVNWRNIWAGRKSVGNLFGKPVVDFSSSQRQLVMWSNVYDNVYKNSECPSDAIIEDDDALDGWMIYQKRKRDKENNQHTIENSLTNEKIRNSEQIYVMCDPTISDQVIVDDPGRVYDCNDFEGKIRLQRIMKQVQSEGCVGFMGLKDTQNEIYRKAAETRV